MTTCTYCAGDHDGCTAESPACCAGKAAQTTDRIQGNLILFALSVLDRMECWDGSASSAAKAMDSLSIEAGRLRIAHWSAGRSVTTASVKAFATSN